MRPIGPVSVAADQNGNRVTLVFTGTSVVGVEGSLLSRGQELYTLNHCDNFCHFEP